MDHCKLPSALTPPPDLPVSVNGDRTHDGSVDLHGRPVAKSTSGGPRAASFIIGVELSERLAFYAIQSNLLRYLTQVLQESSSDAIKNVTNWTGVSLVVPILGSFLADAYWGRYWTIAVVSVVYVLGLLLLTLSVSLRPLRPPMCIGGVVAACAAPSKAQVGFFYMALYLISVGTGGIKPCLEAFGADQFDEEDDQERLGKSSFFNWWYFALSTGSLVALTVLVYAENNWSWGLGFGIPTVAMAAGCALFFTGTPRYRHKIPGGSPLTQIARVLVVAARNAAATLPDNPLLLYETYPDPRLPASRRHLHHTPSLRFLDKAAVRLREDVDAEDENSSVTTTNGCHRRPSSGSSWRLCTVTEVEEVKLVAHLMPVWLCSLAYGVAFAQASTVFVAQVGTLDTELGSGRGFHVPPASFQAVAVVAVLLLLPVYDRVVVPAARRLRLFGGRGIMPLQRMGAGLLVSVFCVCAAALVDVRRLRVAEAQGLKGSSAVLPMSALWTVPQYVLLGVADILTLVGEQEFFYDQVPDSMRSLGMALYLSANGVGYFINTLLQILVNRILTHRGSQPWIQPHHLNSSHYDYFLWLVAMISALNFVAFLFVALSYRYKHVKSPYKDSNTLGCYDNSPQHMDPSLSL